MPKLALFESSSSTALVDPTLLVAPTPMQLQMAKRPLPSKEQVDAVVKNRPLAGFRRDEVVIGDDEIAEGLTHELLARHFPSFQHLGPEFRVDIADEDLDRLVARARASYSQLGMRAQIEAMEEEANAFKDARATLTLLRKEKLFRSGTFLPLELLPDLFMATPVWYFAAAKMDMGNTHLNSRKSLPPLPDLLCHFCDLVPTKRWANLFLLFNYRIRQLCDHPIEFIPPPVADLIFRAQNVFDFVVVATPYHDVAMKDWEEMPWPRLPDPFVLGFQRGLPFVFVLARFSGSGIFPLYHEMVADTVHFLRNSVDAISATFKNSWRSWYNNEESWNPSVNGLTIATAMQNTLAAFDEGRLFDWLREREPAST